MCPHNYSQVTNHAINLLCSCDLNVQKLSTYSEVGPFTAVCLLPVLQTGVGKDSDRISESAGWAVAIVSNNYNNNSNKKERESITKQKIGLSAICWEDKKQYGFRQGCTQG